MKSAFYYGVFPMKKIQLLVCIVFILLVFSSCKNQLLPPPVIPDFSGGRDGWSAPGNLRATHGGKRSIMLTWDSVKKAVRYNIYKADNPLMDFVQCAETANAAAEYTFTVPAGTTAWYKVSAVNAKDEVSPLSTYVCGTSLARPVISGIVEVETNTDTSAAVYWYMNNADEYRDQIRYIVYCFDGDTEKEQKAVDGSGGETSVSFTGLSAHTDYQYQVEAYLEDDQINTEISDTVDAGTADGDANRADIK